MHYAPGTHLLIDLYGAQHLDTLDVVRNTLLKAADKVGATVLNQSFHVFGGHSGITGVVLLKESHISIHTWPETGFAAVDLFLCGGLSPDPAIKVLEDSFEAERTKLTRVLRGQDEG